MGIEQDCKYCDFAQRPEMDILYETEAKQHRIFLAPDQSYLGRCIVATKRHVGRLSDLAREEHGDLYAVQILLEGVLTDGFNPSHFNWMAMMNCPYGTEEPNPHVHWHAVPRYDRPVEFVGVTFIDPTFHYDRERKTDISLEIRAAIQMRIMDLFDE